MTEDIKNGKRVQIWASVEQLSTMAKLKELTGESGSSIIRAALEQYLQTLLESAKTRGV